MRKHDDMFAQQLYQMTRRTFARNLKEALEAKDAWYKEKVRHTCPLTNGVILPGLMHGFIIMSHQMSALNQKTWTTPTDATRAASTYNICMWHI